MFILFDVGSERERRGEERRGICICTYLHTCNNKRKKEGQLADCYGDWST
jgi:hypothetical protein